MAAARVCALALLSAGAVRADMLDVIEPSMSVPVNCSNGCAVWTNLAGSGNTRSQAEIDAMWASRAAQVAAGSSCAMPAAVAFMTGPSAPSQGPRCYCAGTAGQNTSTYGFCSDPIIPTPQQVNLQYSSDGWTVAVAFVTLDRGARQRGAPVVELCTAGVACVNVTGSSSIVEEPQNNARVYSFHTVPLPRLQPATEYSYRCIGATTPANWSPVFSFKSRDADGAPLRFALFGDMGVYPYCNMGNIAADAAAGDIDFVLHLGDHAYNMAMDGGLRGDAYMFGLQPTLSRVPWLSTIGNHEHEGSPFGSYCPDAELCPSRYLNQTAGLLATGAASGSGTNRYYSIDIGLVHFVVLDQMTYLDLESAQWNEAMLAWLQADLEAASAPAQRAAVPWIIVAGHLIMYCSCSDVAGGHHARLLSSIPGACDGDQLIVDIEPMLHKYGVDLYVAGHWHVHETFWPVGLNGTVTQQSYDSPCAPVHLLTGVGGAPAYDTFGPPLPITRSQLMQWSYDRVTVWNATALTVDVIANNDSSVVDSFTIVQPNHGPFSV